MSVLQNIKEINGKICYLGWVEWEHMSVPNSPEWLREIIRDSLATLGHCLICTSLDGCYFKEPKLPQMPMHMMCDCYKKMISEISVIKKCFADCDIRKFTEYIFTDEFLSRGKNKIFEKLGFSIDDSDYLKKEICRQAKEEYLEGNYILKDLDSRGQRVAIPVNLKGVRFYTGWLVCPDGKIKNTTPFGGWIK